MIAVSKLMVMVMVMIVLLSGCMILQKAYCGEPKFINSDQSKIGKEALAYAMQYSDIPLNVREVRYEGACNSGGDWGGEPFRIILEGTTQNDFTLELIYTPANRWLFVDAFDTETSQYWKGMDDKQPDLSNPNYGIIFANQIKSYLKSKKVNVQSVESTLAILINDPGPYQFPELKIKTIVQAGIAYDEQWAENFVRALNMPGKECMVVHHCANDETIVYFTDRSIYYRDLVKSHPEWTMNLE